MAVAPLPDLIFPAHRWLKDKLLIFDLGYYRFQLFA
jgi:hypothetical protein